MPHVACVVCGKISHLKHKPVEVAAAFDGLGMDAMRVALQGTGFDLGHTSGTVLCSAAGRRCYYNLKARLLDVGGLTYLHTYLPASYLLATYLPLATYLLTTYLLASHLPLATY